VDVLPVIVVVVGGVRLLLPPLLRARGYALLLVCGRLAGWCKAGGE